MEILDEVVIKSEENTVDGDIKHDFVDYTTEYDSNGCEAVTQSAQSPPAKTNIPISIPHVNEILSKFICDYCQQQFDKKSQIGAHMVKHKNEHKVHTKKVHKMNLKPLVKDDDSDDRVQCMKCEKWFADQFRLDAHVRSKHEGLRV